MDVDFKRDFYDDVVKSIAKNSVTFLTGPKKCGKTTCLSQIEKSCENASYVNFMALSSKKEGEDVLDKVIQGIRNNDGKVYLLDNIAYAPNPELDIIVVLSALDECKGSSTRIVFSGGPVAAIHRWRREATKHLDVSEELVEPDLLSYQEWLRSAQYEAGSSKCALERREEASYEDFVKGVLEFHKIDSVKEYFKECMKEASFAVSKERNIIYLSDEHMLMEAYRSKLFTPNCTELFGGYIDTHIQKKDKKEFQ